MKPVIALVGRPNVGKSTLFNRLTKTRDAIVADFAGLTRDRHYGNGKLGPHEYIVIDTGGFEPDAGSGIFKEMAKQTRQAVAEADVVIFVVDARDGLSAQDHDIANELRRLGKPCVLAANKAEGMKSSAKLVDFYELGFGEVHAVSAAHGQGIRDLIDLALEPLNRFECYALNTAKDAAEIVRQVDEPNYGYLYDTFHANIEEADLLGCIPRSMACIAHVHISENDRGTPGRGHIPFENVLRTLRQAGYDGWLTIEAFSQALPSLAAATKVWRDFFPSTDQVWREGIVTIRNGWSAAR